MLFLLQLVVQSKSCLIPEVQDTLSQNNCFVALDDTALKRNGALPHKAKENYKAFPNERQREKKGGGKERKKKILRQVRHELKAKLYHHLAL